MSETNHCEYCSHALYAGTKCKHCGRGPEQPEQPQQGGLEMVDDEGENRAVRMFLALYGGACGVTSEQMRKHLKMAGFDGAWPEWANSNNGHLTKAGAQLWIRHLFALAEQPAHQHIEHCLWARNGNQPCPHVQPAQRTWVNATTWRGLTDEEVKHEWVVWRASIPRYMGFAKGIEAKLKEKNSD